MKRLRKVRKFRATPAGVENRPEGGRTGEEPGAQGPNLKLKCPCDRKERIDMNIDGDGTSAGAELAGVAHRAELAGAVRLLVVLLGETKAGSS